MKSLRLVCLAASLLAVVPQVSHARSFTDDKGRVIEAEILEVKGETVKIRRTDGKDYTLAITNFAAADQAFIRGWKPAGGTPAAEAPVPVDDDVKPGATLTLQFPELAKDRKDQVAACLVRLPASYDPAKPFGLVVWLEGGDGGNQPNSSFVPEGSFVLAGLPYPLGANNPSQANMVGEYDKVWEFHRAILDRIYQKIPNLKKEWGIIGGFSNGGHAMDGMLRVRDRKGSLASYFGTFVIADGGGGYASADGNYPSLEGKYAYVCWGQTSPNATNSAGVAKDFKGRRAQTVASEMAETGHAFAGFEREKVREWIKTVVMPGLGIP